MALFHVKRDKYQGKLNNMLARIYFLFGRLKEGSEKVNSSGSENNNFDNSGDPRHVE